LHRFKGEDGSWYNSVKYVAIEKFNNELLLQDVTSCGAFPSTYPFNYTYTTHSLHGNDLLPKNDTVLGGLNHLQVSVSTIHFLLSFSKSELIDFLIRLSGKNEAKITHGQRRQFLSLLFHLNTLSDLRLETAPLLTIYTTLNFDFRGRMYYMFPAGPHFNRLSRLIFSTTPALSQSTKALQTIFNA